MLINLVAKYRSVRDLNSSLERYPKGTVDSILMSSNLRYGWTFVYKRDISEGQGAVGSLERKHLNLR